MLALRNPGRTVQWDSPLCNLNPLSSSIVKSAQPRWPPALSHMVTMACTAQEAFLLNVNSQVLGQDCLTHTQLL